MAWKRSSVRSRPGPPMTPLKTYLRALSSFIVSDLVASGSKFLESFCLLRLLGRLSELAVDCIHRRSDAFRQLLHVHIGRSSRARMPEQSLNIFDRPLPLRQRSDAASDDLKGCLL